MKISITKMLVILMATMMIVVGCTKAKEPVQSEENSTDLEILENNEDEADQEYVADIVVIGAGGAGMSAAIEAYDGGASVVILEKMPNIGGNTIRSEGGLNAAESAPQIEQGIEDSVEVMVADTIKGGKELNDPELVQFFAENSNDAVDWLTELGMDVSEVVQGAGATNKRMHRSVGGVKVGSVLVPILEKNLNNRGIVVLLNTEAKKILSEDGKVVGVEAVNKEGETQIFKAHSVIVATGGFGANEEMFTKYREDLVGFKTTNHPGATGDGVIMAEELGADTVDMEQIQTNPTVEVTTTTVISESVRGNGAILVNQEGNRFISEMSTRDVLSSAILKETDKVAYLIFDEGVFSSMKVLQENFEMGIITKADTIEELAKIISVDENNLKETVSKWNDIVATKNDEEFGRETGLEKDLSMAPYYAIKVSPAVHYTMGGLKINTKSEVINKEGSPIPGLYAAGEVTGGVHGGNRLGGNAVADIVIFGRQAGISSAEYSKNFEHVEAVLPIQVTKIAVPMAQGDYKDGIYKGSAVGNNGPIDLEVEVKDKNIIRVTVLNHKETENIFKPVENDFVNSIIETQSLEVDTITGATVSSNAVIEAIEEALK